MPRTPKGRKCAGPPAWPKTRQHDALCAVRSAHPPAQPGKRPSCAEVRKLCDGCRPFDAGDLCVDRLLRRRPCRNDGSRRRIADDTAPGTAVRHSPGSGCRHGPALRRRDEERRDAGPRLHAYGRLAGGPTSRGLGAALLVTALALIFRASLLAYFRTHFPDLRPRRTGALTVVTGGILGVLVSISSVGAGALGVTALIILYPRLPTARLVGSDIAHAVPLTLIAGIGHWILGSIDTVVLGSLLTGSIPGIVVGSWMTIHVPDRLLRLALAAVLFIVGGRLVI